MSFFDRLKNELIDIIEWLDDSRDTVVYRFERYANEIKYGAQLVVREGQAAVFINEGKIADIFTPGTYTLETQNLPILATLKGWKYGFESPFKAEVYFVSTRKFTDQKWGTKNPIMLRDAEFGPVRLRAFGSYVFKVAKPDTFIKEIVGTDGDFTTDEITSQLRNIIVTRFSDLVGESKIPVLDLAANYEELSKFCQDKMVTDMDNYGLAMSTFLVENISLPPAVEEALDKRSSMGIVGNLNAFTQFQAANAMEQAASNPNGGGAADGMGLGMGFAMAQQMSNSMNQGQNSAPPPPPPPASWYVAVNGQQTGPFDLNTLKMQAQQGQLKGDSLMWTAGMGAWQAASSIPTLQSLFAAPPPPPPPPVS